MTPGSVIKINNNGKPVMLATVIVNPLSILTIDEPWDRVLGELVKLYSRVLIDF